MPSIFDASVELRHLRYFCAVAEARNFTRAADTIGLRQPTLSHQIRQLEEALGDELFQRTRRGCQLTAAGELLLPYAKRVVGEMSALRHALADLSGLKRGTLTIAALPVLGQCLLPRALAGFHQRHPGVQVRIQEMSIDEMARHVTDGFNGMCIGTLDTVSRLSRSTLLFEEELVAVIQEGSPWERFETLSVAQLVKAPLIIPPSGYGTRSLILRAWSKARHLPHIVLEANSTEVVLQTVAAGGGVGVLPASALWCVPAGRWRVRRIARAALRRKIGVWRIQGGPRPPAVDAMIPFLQVAANTAQNESPAVGAAIRLPAP